MVYQKVCNYWLQWLSGGQFSFAQCFIKHLVLHEFSYLKAVKYTSLDFFPYLFVETSGGKQTCCLLCPLPSESSSLLLTWYVRVEAVFSCSVQQEGETERHASQVLTLVLMATLVWHNVGCQYSCPRVKENKGTLCTHLEALRPVQSP